jgi:FkbM family methyltransferase
MFYSQFGEDRILADVFRNKGRGLCVEVGANDGVNDSTSYFFEKLGWDCILVEPNPALCADIRKVRKAQLFECAASAENGEATLYIAEGPERAHGVSGLGVDQGTAQRIEGYGFVARPITVRTRTLDDILNEAGVDRSPDFVSIDVEGHEHEVLKGFSIEKWKPVVIVAEDNSNFEDATVALYLRRFGYVPYRRTGVNDWYAHLSNRLLVKPSSRTAYWWAGFRTKARRRLRKIPGLLAVRDQFFPR